MSVPFDQALEAPGPLLAAWDLTPWRDARTLTLFSLADGGARALADASAPVGEEAALADSVRARGIPIGAYDSRCELVWRAGQDGVTVWDPHRRVLHASGGALTLANGRTVPRAEVERVWTWADDRYVARGVRARLRQGGEVTLVRDISPAAAADPAYSRNELLFDTEWAGAIAAAVASWAGVPWEDGI